MAPASSVKHGVRLAVSSSVLEYFSDHAVNRGGMTHQYRATCPKRAESELKNVCPYL